MKKNELKFTRNELLLLSVFGYVGVGILMYFFPDLGLLRSLLFLGLGIKDVLFFLRSPTATITQQIDFGAIKTAIDNGDQSRMYYYLALNRIVFFPVLLTLYLVYLLIDQTQLRGLHQEVLYQTLSEQILLVVTILSGIFLVYKEESDAQYTTKTSSFVRTYMYVGLSILLGGLTTYIIFNQTQESLGNITYMLSIVSGFLVFLVGLLLLEEDNLENEEGSEADEKLVAIS